ncbi:MAG: DNA polymerase III subunit alpha [Chromatiales bacterium]|nr:DNA polymerase III subunit alpha [Chromatiales bacterium]
MSGFVHLHLHTEYSIVDSVVRVPALVDAARAACMPAVAVTDQGNLFALVKFYRAAMARGIKPVVGAEVWCAADGDVDNPARLVLLCRDLEAYRRLSRLLSRSWLEGQHKGLPVIGREWLTRESVLGLIALSGGREGVLGRPLLAGDDERAGALLEGLLEVFGGDFFVELQRTGRPQEARYLEAAVEVASRVGAPVVATNDVRFLAASDFDAHEARVCIRQGRQLGDPARPREYSDQQYLRSPAEMAELFADLPEALENSVHIATRCNLELQLGETHLPDYPIPEGETPASHLRRLSNEGLRERIGSGDISLAEGREQEAYDQRLERELDVICRMDFPGYFLIVADFIAWAKRAGIPVGPGRGSGAGSLVAYALGITDLDPLRYELLFERFLNAERVSMPDFDIDFCMEGRDRVIEYVSDRYGADRVSQIITYGTMAARAVVRDVGRILGHPYGFVDRIAKLIPNDPGLQITLDKALEQEAELRALCDEDEEVRAIIELARQLEGLVRNAGRHAGGLVIAPRTITDFTPLYRVEGERATVTQFDKDDVEAAGLVKFDFLGLRTLTIIDRAVQIVNARRSGGEPPLDIRQIPLDDPATFRLLKSCQTTAVFQLESRGMRDLIKRLQPDCFDDIVALVALFRPGPLQSGMVDDFIARKHGDSGALIDYLHPDLEPVLKSTYGVILYQEQVMQIAQRLAGYSLGEADLLRRAMGKKKAAEMAEQRTRFVEGADERGVDRGQASRIFDLMEKFAGYGFNRSHSAAYALLSYQTAWLKARHPAAFMAAVMTSDRDDTDQLQVLRRECVQLGLSLLPPDINCSDFGFAVESPREIRYGLGAIKGVGQGAVEQLVAEREEHGTYTSLLDLCRRAVGQRVGKRVLEALVKSGALDGMAPSRAMLLAALPSAVSRAETLQRSHAAGQDDLFGGGGAESAEETLVLPNVAEWGWGQRLAAERESLGLYLSGHPFDQYRADLSFLCTASIQGIAAEPPPPQPEARRAGREVSIAGLVAGLRKRAGRVSVELDDGQAIVEVMLFQEAFDRFRHLLTSQALVVVTGQLRFDEFLGGWRVVAREVSDLDRTIEHRANGLIIRWRSGHDATLTPQLLHEVLGPYRPGPCAVTLFYSSGRAQGQLRLGEAWSVQPARALREQLSALVGIEGFRFLYA